MRKLSKNVKQFWARYRLQEYRFVKFRTDSNTNRDKIINEITLVNLLLLLLYYILLL